MKTTVELPDDLFVAAKKSAAARRTTLRSLLERGLRRELRGPAATGSRSRRRRASIRWVTVHGGLPPGLDIASRTAMYEWLQR